MGIAERPTEQAGESPALESAPPAVALPPGELPHDAVRAEVRRCRAGGSPGALVRAIDRYGQELEQEIGRKLAEDRAEFLRLVRRLEVLHAHMATRRAQARWLARWPRGPAPDAAPIGCRLASGRVVAVPALLAPLLELELRERPAGDEPLSARRMRVVGAHRRRGAGPAMSALADAGLTAADVARELGCCKTTAWRYFNGRDGAPARLHDALERLVGAESAAEILALIPRRT